MVNVNVELRNEAVHRSLAAFEDDDDAFRQTLHPGIEWCPIEENRVSLHGVEAAVRLRLGSSRTGLSAWRSTSRRPGPVSRRSRDTGSSPSAVPAPRLRRRPGPRPGSPMSSPPAGWTRVVRSGSGARTGRARRSPGAGRGPHARWRRRHRHGRPQGRERRPDCPRGRCAGRAGPHDRVEVDLRGAPMFVRPPGEALVGRAVRKELREARVEDGANNVLGSRIRGISNRAATSSSASACSAALA
jgi:hypothetical protein